MEQLPSKAPFSKRFEEVVGQACESAPVRRVAHQFHLPERTVRAIDVRYLQRWAARRRKPALRQMGVDEIYLGKSQKFLTDRITAGRLPGSWPFVPRPQLPSRTITPQTTTQTSQ